MYSIVLISFSEVSAMKNTLRKKSSLPSYVIILHLMFKRVYDLSRVTEGKNVIAGAEC